MQNLLEKFQGCLLGAAIGDALGMPVEFQTKETIKKLYCRINDLLPHEEKGYPAGYYTDDTKMMMCQLQSIIDNRKLEIEDICKKLVYWHNSKDLREIDMTCNEAILKLKKGTNFSECGRTGDFATSNGAVVRTIPLALLNYRDIDKLKEDVTLATTITHNNPEAINGSLAIASMLASILNGEENVPKILNTAIDFIELGSTVHKQLTKARDFFNKGFPTEKALLELGTSGNVAETVASAVYCFIRNPVDFKEALIESVMGGDDTDTRTAITGALAGAYNGPSKMPTPWVEKLEDSAKIEDLAVQLYNIATKRLSVKI